MSVSSGHVFVIQGDLKKFACDAWLLPTDDQFSVTSTWRGAHGITVGIQTDQEPWQRDERVRLMPQPPGSPLLWLGLVGKGGATANWFVDAAEAFIRQAAATLQPKGEQKGRPRGRWPLLAINHVGTGHGGASFTKGELLEELFSRIVPLAARLKVDIAVVSFDDRAHAAAQRARMHALGGRGDDAIDRAVLRWTFESPERTSVLADTARGLAAHVDSRQLALFIGAGVSVGAGLPGWTKLLEQLGGSLDPAVVPEQLASLNDDRDRAAFLERRFEDAGRSLGAELKRLLAHSRYSLQHGLLSSMAISEVTTTNFDELFELASTTNSRPLNLIPGGSAADGGRWLLKLHGTVSDPPSLVFTRAAYLDAPRQRGALFGLVQAMLMTRHMLFVGYGLADEDFHDLVHEVRYAQPKTLRSRPLGTTVTLFEDPVRAEMWQDELDVVHMRTPTGANGKPTDSDVARAGRDVELFLDLVGMLCADRSAFILDSQYHGMLSPTELALLERVGPLREFIDADDKRDGWRLIAEVLRRLGA